MLTLYLSSNIITKNYSKIMSTPADEYTGKINDEFMYINKREVLFADSLLIKKHLIHERRNHSILI